MLIISILDRLNVLIKWSKLTSKYLVRLIIFLNMMVTKYLSESGINSNISFDDFNGINLYSV